MALNVLRLILLISLSWAPYSLALDQVQLNFEQSNAFRAWFVRIVKEQINRGPSPRWTHQDCAGLVRFGVYEALKSHDRNWLKANGILNENLPPEVNLSKDQQELLNRWILVGGMQYGSFVSAIGIIQENSVFVSKQINHARPGDLLFFDQGDDQHIMIWMGSYVAYHTGNQKSDGLRSVSIDQLMNWRDPRWQPKIDNPNFIGIYRLSFLSC